MGEKWDSNIPNIIVLVAPRMNKKEGTSKERPQKNRCGGPKAATPFVASYSGGRSPFSFFFSIQGAITFFILGVLEPIHYSLLIRSGGGSALIFYVFGHSGIKVLRY